MERKMRRLAPRRSLTLSVGRAILRRQANHQRRVAAGGGGGIRTHGTLAGTAVFKTAALNHSTTPPGRLEIRRQKAEVSLRRFGQRRPHQQTFRISRRPVFTSAFCFLPSDLRQQVHIQRDLQPQSAVLAELVQRQVQRDRHFLHQAVGRAAFGGGGGGAG